METPDKRFSELVGLVKSWIPRRTEPPNVSRDFWMPDQSCRVCYECDSQFTIFNRRHHCRSCGRVFCAKCTSNSIPVSPDDPKNSREEGERIRVCNYCFEQWTKEIASADNGILQISSPGLSPSPSSASLASSKCSGHSSSTVNSMPYRMGPYQCVTHGTGRSPRQSTRTEFVSEKQDLLSLGRNGDAVLDIGETSPTQSEFFINREQQHFGEDDKVSQIDQVISINNDDPMSTNIPDENSLDSVRPGQHADEGEGHDNECDSAQSIYGTESADAEPVDFENNFLLWFPPDPEDEEDEREAIIFDDDDDDDALAEWGNFHSSSGLGSSENRTRDRSSEEHKRAMKNVVDGHFRALVAQLLQVDNLPIDEEDDKGGWLDIITSLSWEAASLLKPDTSKGGGMDPGGYVKIKCLASGHRSESMVVKGIVCKKNVAHRRMTSKIQNPRIFILGGALEYQRVANLLSSFDTLLQQEMDHLKMAVAKIDSHQPDILLVEKSVSRFAQDYLLAKDISLVLNVKRPLLERIARCTGAQIVPSIDNLSQQKLGTCESFHVDKFIEEHGSAGQAGKKLLKTLMFFEGCPKPLGCTILLKGANGDELKKVKHVVQYGVFAAYHLALETSFLADEGATLPELPLKSPITVALPDKPSNADRSISMVPGFMVPAASKPPLVNEVSSMRGQAPEHFPLQGTNSRSSSMVSVSSSSYNAGYSPYTGSVTINPSRLSNLNQVQNVEGPSHPPLSIISLPEEFSKSYDEFKPHFMSEQEKNNLNHEGSFKSESLAVNVQGVAPLGSPVCSCDFMNALDRWHATAGEMGGPYVADRQLHSPGQVLSHQENSFHDEHTPLKEEFPPSPSDHQSILGYRCHSCEMPSEAHVHCYTHRQGSLTISVKKLPDFMLPGEREGKIWMWHRCLKCPRNEGFPPATRRVVMSDAAWGLSFGKFLELSFSNHAAASRVASCGHSLHRDCLRFYGFGRMVACFRYASIDVHSVYLPPSKLDFDYQRQEWIQQEADQVVSKAELFFAEVLNSLRPLSDKILNIGSRQSGIKVIELRRCLGKLEELLQKEKGEFEDSLQKALSKDLQKGQPAADLLEINRLRRQLLFHSYLWDNRLLFLDSLLKKTAAFSVNNLTEGLSCSATTTKDKPNSADQMVGVNSGPKQNGSLTSTDSMVLDAKVDEVCKGNLHAVNSDGGLTGLSNSLVSSMQGQEGAETQSKAGDPTSEVDIKDQNDPQECTTFRRVLSEGHFPIVASLSDTLDAAWTGENQLSVLLPQELGAVVSDPLSIDSSGKAANSRADKVEILAASGEKVEEGATDLVSATSPKKISEHGDDLASWSEAPFANFYQAFGNNASFGALKVDMIGEYNPTYLSSFRELERQGGARLLLPVGVNDTVVPVYDDEPTSAVAYALVCPDYHSQLSDEREKIREGGDSLFSLPFSDSASFHPLQSLDEVSIESLRSFGSSEDGISTGSGSKNSLSLDPVVYTKAMHVKVSFTDEGPLGKVKYTVTCYYAKQFDALRHICCPTELDFIRSVSRCKKWGAQGGKSNVFFAKTLDDRFIIKQVTKTELDSFIKFAPAYFKYLSEAIGTGSPTCLAKILGIYQVSAKHLKGGKDTKMDFMIMENLLFRRKVTRLYDLKGASRSRYNSDSSGTNKVLLDQNLIESMPTSPIFVGNKAKRLLERAVWNDTSFLASIDVMDYSLLVGVDEEKHELVVGIIDYMRQYTWDKHLESWVKTSAIFGGTKDTLPTVISPKQYKKRFRKAMSAYFLMVPDQWSPPSIIPSASQSNLGEENLQNLLPD
ncbi:1-phosphatidylinositol-3-phosphate 5-kinase [Nymphaea thermarum]|nr:1-phosphatidylinositol-3-phosphate 5-kinase [Nymphaea thermarum]